MAAQPASNKKNVHICCEKAYSSFMRKLVALGFLALLLISACGGGSTTNTPDGDTSGSLEQTNARLTALVQTKIAQIEGFEGFSVVDSSNYSSSNYVVNFMVLKEISGILASFSYYCEYQLTSEKYTRISYTLEISGRSEPQTGDAYCPASE